MKRRKWTPELKAKIVIESLSGRSIAEICNKYEINQATKLNITSGRTAFLVTPEERSKIARQSNVRQDFNSRTCVLSRWLPILPSS